MDEEPDDRDICSACEFYPACRTRREMEARHGTPARFRQAVLRSLGEFCSWQEAQSAIRAYERDYARAPGAPPTMGCSVPYTPCEACTPCPHAPTSITSTEVSKTSLPPTVTLGCVLLGPEK